MSALDSPPTGAQICTLGYEAMKLYVRPQVYLWLSDDWIRCHQVTAERIPGERDIGIHLHTWRAGTILADVTPN